MLRVLALTPETELIADLRKVIGANYALEISAYLDELDFLESFQEIHSELVILDIDYLGKRTVKMMRILKNLRKDCIVILLVSEKKIALCSEALSLGAFSYLIKPVSAVNACKLIATALHLDENG